MGKIKYFSVKDSGADFKINLIHILKGVVVSTALAIFLLLVAALLFTYTDISMTFVKNVGNIVFYTAAFISGIAGSYKLKSFGWLHGLLAGIIYSLVVFTVGLLSEVKNTTVHFPAIKILLSTLIGGVGGISGVNLNFSKNKRR